MSDQERFWKKVRRGRGCWNWTAGLFATGYGQFYWKGQSHPAHRVSYTFTVGRIPTGKHVLHKCDNRRCVRPDHLFVGTAFDNMRDKVAKQRQARGSKQGLSKLTEADVRRIRHLHHKRGYTPKQLAPMFGVNGSNICHVLLGRTWAWLV